MSRTIAIDEEGYFLLQDGIRLNDVDTGRAWLDALVIDNFGVTTFIHEGEPIIVEAFDKPLVARQVHVENGQLAIQCPYEARYPVILESLCLDDWDRFHGLTVNHVPFVLSHPAQSELFNLATEFGDDHLVLAGQKVETPPYYLNPEEVNKEPFWSDKYQENPLPPWDLGQSHPELASFLQQLKLNKLRILVPGCGYAHDAAFLAQQGHVVTAVDISPTALETAKKQYGHIKNLKLVQADVLDLPEAFHNSFDLIFEHTFYCAITPDKRDQLIKIWKRCLVETGHILGIFFVVPKRSGPYFGGSEWELREKLQKHFQFLYWTRLKHSPDWRAGAELMIYCQIKA